MISPRILATAALLASSTIRAATAQAPPGEMPAASTPPRTTKLADLTNRYRFTEQYARDDDKAKPWMIGPYRAGIVEVARDIVDTPQGAPRQMEASRQTIFVERPAELNAVGGVSSTVRKVERYRARPEDPSRMMGPRPLEGLTALIRPRPGELPLVQGLTEGRSLTDYEFEAIARQSFVPSLGLILPGRTVRLDDTWPIPRRAAQAMLGDPGIQGDTLVGRLVEIRKEVEGERRVARITVAGKAPGPGGEVSVNAEALFTFWPESDLKGFSADRTFPPRPKEDVIEGRGAVTELRLARLTTAELPGPGRLRFRSHRELIVHRQLGLGTDAGPVPPALAPEATEANSWLTYLEPSGKFSIRHPQDLLPADRGPVAPLEADAVALVRTRREATDLLQVEYVPRTLAPEALKQKMATRFALMKLEVLPGVEEWLPDADWPDRRVHRIEAVVKVTAPRASAPSGSPRIHFGGYLIQFGQSASILAVATTSRDAVAPYRREVEQVLKSIRIGPAAPR